MGLIARHEDPDDRRIRRVGITTAGAKLVHQMIEARHEWLSRLTSGLTPQEQQEVVRALGYLTRAAQRAESVEAAAAGRR